MMDDLLHQLKMFLFQQLTLQNYFDLMRKNIKIGFQLGKSGMSLLQRIYPKK